jgi:hypothetical protein
MAVEHEVRDEDIDIVVGSREQLFHLIAEASEIEHTLMCSYLYAAFSLRRAGDAALSPHEAEAVERWRKSILTVATDEMVHLLLVANLSIALGGRPHFDRPNFPVAPGYFPSGVIVKLTPFSPETLDHFVYLERPQGIDHADGDGFQHEEEYQREQAYVGLMPSVQDYATVGRLYEAVRVNLRSCARRYGEDALFVGPDDTQVGPDAVELAGIATIHDLHSALAAIDTIVEQGEGSPRDREDSHYHRFREIQAEYEALRSTNPQFQPAWPVAENPVMRRPPEPDDKVFIDAPTSARVLDYANATYALLLRCLVQAFGRRGEDAKEVQARVLDAAITLMHVLGQVSTLLASLPASASHPGVNAGMTFTMLRSVQPLFAGPAERQIGAERLDELARGAEDLTGVQPMFAGIAKQMREIAAALGVQA